MTTPDAAMTREQVLREALEQIRATCVGNSPAGCAHDLALKFVLSVADKALASTRQEPAPAAEADRSRQESGNPPKVAG